MRGYGLDAAKVRDKWGGTVVNVIMNIRFSLNARNFLAS